MEKEKSSDFKNALDSLFELQAQVVNDNLPDEPFEDKDILKAEDVNKIGRSIQAILEVLKHLFETETGVVNHFKGNKTFKGMVTALSRVYARQAIVGAGSINSSTSAGIHNYQNSTVASSGKTQGISSVYRGENVSIGVHRFSNRYHTGSTWSNNSRDYRGLVYLDGGNPHNLISHTDSSRIDVNHGNAPLVLKSSSGIYLNAAGSVVCNGNIKIDGNLTTTQGWTGVMWKKMGGAIAKGFLLRVQNGFVYEWWYGNY